MSQTQPELSPIVKVARDLTAITELAGSLEDAAMNDSNDRLMPGGLALVALADVANLEAWAHRVDTLERLGKRDLGDDDDDWEPPLQTLLYWSEKWRREHGSELDGRRATITSEANLIRWALDWALAHEPRFAAFTSDIARARARLEDLVSEGLRSRHGVRCFDCELDLVRPSRKRKVIRHCDGNAAGVCGWPHRFCPEHDRGGLADEWLCLGCGRRYTLEDYSRAVYHAHFVHAEFLPLEMAAERTGVRAGTIKVWATRGTVARQRDLNSGRVGYHIANIIARRDMPLAERITMP